MIVMEDSSVVLGTNEKKVKENAREGYLLKQSSEEELD